MMKKSGLFLALAIAAAIPVNADVLANYTFSSSLRSSSDSDPNSVAGDIIDGSGLTSAIDAVRGNPTPSLAIVSTDTDGTTQATAVTANDYISFNITPTAGMAFNLTSLTFDYANYTNDATFPSETFFVRSSRDSFGANLAGAVTAASGSNGSFAGATITLTGATFQNVTTPIEFRIYFLDSTNDPDRGALVDNIVLNGTLAAIPEPSTWMMIGVGAILFAGVQHFRRKL